MASGFLEEGNFRRAIQHARQAQDADEKLNKIIEALEALKNYVDAKNTPDTFGMMPETI